MDRHQRNFFIGLGLMAACLVAIPVVMEMSGSSAPTTTTTSATTAPVATPATTDTTVSSVASATERSPGSIRDIGRPLAPKGPSDEQIVRQAFGPAEEQQATPVAPAWQSALAGKQSQSEKQAGQIKTACEISEKYTLTARAMTIMADRSPVSWEELKLTPDGAKAKLKLAGLDAAKALLGVSRLPAKVREASSCKEGGEREFYGADLASSIAAILTAVDASPEEVGTNAARLRGIALADYRSRVAADRRAIAVARQKEEKGEGDSDLRAALKFLGRTLVEAESGTFKIRTRELGVPAAEAAEAIKFSEANPPR